MNGNTLLEFCQGSNATALHNGDQTLDANDLLLFALHTGSGASLGTVLAVSATPDFAFIPGLLCRA